MFKYKRGVKKERKKEERIKMFKYKRGVKKERKKERKKE